MSSSCRKCCSYNSVRSLWYTGSLSQSRPSHSRSSITCRQYSGRQRSGSRSSSRSTMRPPALRADSHANKPAHTLPRCIRPLGLGANRPHTGRLPCPRICSPPFLFFQAYHTSPPQATACGLARRITKNIHPRMGVDIRGLGYHASPAHDARLPSDSEHKQQTKFAWFIFLASVHPHCSRRLRRLNLFLFHGLRRVDCLLLSGRRSIRPHRHPCRREPPVIIMLGRTEFALRNSRLTPEICGAKAPGRLAALLRGLPHKKTAPP